MKTIECFKNKCKMDKKTEEINNISILEKYNKLNISQEEFGNSYRPIFQKGLIERKIICPNCRNILNRINVPDGGWNRTYIYSCHCGYEYAW